MNQQQLTRMGTGQGFIAALDQSGGSTPKALKLYGIDQDRYASEAEMFDLVHQMRTRIVTSPAFTGNHILGAILFEQTMDRTVQGKLTADYLWEDKGVVPFLKVDKGLAQESQGVQLMKPMDQLAELLDRAKERRIFGTKMRSVIKEANPQGIAEIVDQQFHYGRQICAAGLVPILEPEVDIHCPDKAQAEAMLKEATQAHLKALDDGDKVMFKFTIPSVEGFYSDVMADPHVLRVVALSGGYSREESNQLLARNPGLIASFSRALTEGLTAQQSDQEFNAALEASVLSIYKASVA